ncbi:GNAT family N-acetyltransferase [Bacillus sp. SD088]|uniref:GNAT family N-acetyltransferase n=1 Tax=Bacillus sp. SD088 TaxID=2782012 RepID=UPI001D7B6DC3|nr:GNAT family N-acetyltransferase [Bacillus sp. SD088]MBO0993169.1 GNAT family N-acetyltransferase [Bacillus sp. SD088]
METQQFVGWMLLNPFDALGAVEIEWRLRPKYWGKGYVTEAVKVILQYAVEGLKLQEVIAEIHKMNKGSISVAEKIGMELEYKGIEETSDYVKYVLSQHGVKNH